jgi:hypothetical protein
LKTAPFPNPADKGSCRQHGIGNLPGPQRFAENPDPEFRPMLGGLPQHVSSHPKTHFFGAQERWITLFDER